MLQLFLPFVSINQIQVKLPPYLRLVPHSQHALKSRFKPSLLEGTQFVVMVRWELTGERE